MLFNKPFSGLSQSIFFFIIIIKNPPLVLLIYSLRSRTITSLSLKKCCWEVVGNNQQHLCEETSDEYSSILLFLPFDPANQQHEHLCGETSDEYSSILLFLSFDPAFLTVLPRVLFDPALLTVRSCFKTVLPGDAIIQTKK